MKSLTNEEYIRLLERLIEQQYGEETVLPEELVWVPAESQIKEKIGTAARHNLVDLTNIKKDKIKEQIFDHQALNITVGPFKIRVSEYNKTDNGMNACLAIYEDKRENGSNKTSNITNRVDILKDNRFDGRPWKKYFTTLKRGNYIPLEEVIEIIRWLQAINKLTAFL